MKWILNQVILILLVLLFFTGLCGLCFAKPELAGKVVSLNGNLNAIGKDNVKRPLAKYSTFYDGETLITDSTARAQLLFTDGSFVALPASTRFKIDNYYYKKNNAHKEKDKYIVSLVEGAFRTITGAIGKSNPDNYQVNTVNATTGIRGTFFGTEINPEGQFICVKKGSIYVKNRAGSITLGKGSRYDFAIISSANKAPLGSDKPPAFLFKYFSQHLYSGQTPNISNGYEGYRLPVLDQDVYHESDAYLFTDFPERLKPEDVAILMHGGNVN